MKIIRLPKKCSTIGLVRDYGTMITIVRLECGLTQKELAEKLGHLSETYICLIEKNKRKLKADTLEKIAEICDVPISTFFEHPVKIAALDAVNTHTPTGGD